MRRIIALILMLSFLALGSGALQYLHNLDHLHHDGQAEHHDESNCFVHAQLHVPTISAGWVPVLVFLGIFVAFLTEIATPLVSQRAFFRLDCRGPPAC